MSISMYTASVPVLDRMLVNLLAWLDKAEAHARERGFEPDQYLSMKLAPDMLPFAKQIQIASDAAKGCVCRLAGQDVPKWPDDETTLQALRERTQRTLDLVRSMKPAQIDGSETRSIVIPMRTRDPITFDGENYLRHWALPNFFFHVTTAYALLRHAGVALGKADYLGG